MAIWSKTGVCALPIAEKRGVTQATLSEHKRVLVKAGLIRSRRIKQWIFYKRDEEYLTKIRTSLLADL